MDTGSFPGVKPRG